MHLEVLRFSSGKAATLGALYVQRGGGKRFLCFTLEDRFQTEKKYSETRIPAGRYRITLRTEGGHHARYTHMFPAIHRGMLWIRDVPNFEFILIHIGNTDDDTAGCLLVGDSAVGNVAEKGSIGSSKSAYQRIYPTIAEAIEAGEEVWIQYTNYDTPPEL